jgi:UrcA family protein
MNASNTLHLSCTWLAAIAAIACNLTAGNASAATPAAKVPTVTVSYADLDLSKPAGVEMLYQRIKDAARTVCAPLASKGLTREGVWRLWRDCYEQAVSNAVASINRPTLTALHRATRTARG